MVVDYFHQRTTIVSAKACVNALDGLYCSKNAAKGPIPVLMSAAGGHFFAFVQTIPPPGGGGGGSPDLSGQGLFHRFLSGRKPYAVTLCGRGWGSQRKPPPEMSNQFIAKTCPFCWTSRVENLLVLYQTFPKKKIWRCLLIISRYSRSYGFSNSRTKKQKARLLQ